MKYSEIRSFQKYLINWSPSPWGLGFICQFQRSVQDLSPSGQGSATLGKEMELSALIKF